MPPENPLNRSRSERARVCAAPDVLTIAEAARRLRIGRNSAYEAAQRGELPVLRIGRRLLAPRLALERLLAGDGSLATAGTETRDKEARAGRRPIQLRRGRSARP